MKTLKKILSFILTVAIVIALFKIVFFVANIFLKLILLLLIIGVTTTFVNYLFKKE